MGDALSHCYTCKGEPHGVALTSNLSGQTSLHWLKPFTSAALELAVPIIFQSVTCDSC